MEKDFQIGPPISLSLIKIFGPGRRVSSSKKKIRQSALTLNQLAISLAMKRVDNTDNTDEALLLHDTVLNPNTPRAHHIRHHYVGEESIPDNSNLAR